MIGLSNNSDEETVEGSSTCTQSERTKKNRGDGKNNFFLKPVLLWNCQRRKSIRRIAGHIN